MSRKAIYSIGDKVRIVKYGFILWESKNSDQPRLTFPLIHETESLRYLDMSPELVGQEGIVSKVTITQGVPKYAISGISGKSAWYDEQQMELINQPN